MISFLIFSSIFPGGSTDPICPMMRVVATDSVAWSVYVLIMTTRPTETPEPQWPGVTMGWARWAKSRGGEFRGPEFQTTNLKSDFPVTVKIRTPGYQTLECFIATLPT